MFFSQGRTNNHGSAIFVRPFSYSGSKLLRFCKTKKKHAYAKPTRRSISYRRGKGVALRCTTTRRRRTDAVLFGIPHTFDSSRSVCVYVAPVLYIATSLAYSIDSAASRSNCYVVDARWRRSISSLSPLPPRSWYQRINARSLIRSVFKLYSKMLEAVAKKFYESLVLQFYQFSLQLFRTVVYLYTTFVSA